jgi:SAM-dependent methyltransferase
MIGESGGEHSAPPNHSVQDFYDGVVRSSYARSTDQKERELRTRGATFWVVQELIRLFPSRAIARVIEVGGEYAPTLGILAKQFNVGIAISSDLVIPSVRNSSIEYVRAPIEGLARKLKARNFDLALLIDVIEHLYDPDAALNEIGLLLKPGGVLVIVTPNLASWLNRLMLLVGWMPLDMEVSTRVVVGRPSVSAHPVGHIRLFTTRAIREILSVSGFEVLRIVSCHNEFVVGGDEAASGSGVGTRPEPHSEVRGRGPRMVVPLVRRLDRVMSRLTLALGSRIVVIARLRSEEHE